MGEAIDRRVLGAIRILDRATNTMITRKLIVTANNVSLVRNRTGLYVFTRVNNLEHHTDSFLEPPLSPPVESIEVELKIIDPQLRYLPRLLTVSLPRNPDPEDLEESDSLFQPRDVLLYASPNARVSNNWSTIRASVLRNDPEEGLLPVSGSLLRVLRASSDEILGSGISDQRGEVLIIVPGVPVTRFADDDDDDDDAVELSELPIQLEVSHTSGSDWPINPQLLEENHSANILSTQNLSLSTGRMEQTSIELT